MFRAKNRRVDRNTRRRSITLFPASPAFIEINKDNFTASSHTSKTEELEVVAEF
jgi:hypothetical protein